MNRPDRRGTVPPHLANARRRDGDVKEERARLAIRQLQRGGHRLTFAGVAREARVSTWFLYNKADLTAALRAAIEDQQTHGAAAAESPDTRVSPASLATDLALARTEIRDLRQQRDQLRNKVQLALGAELDAVATHELLERIRELEHENATLRHDLTTHSARANEATVLADRLEADLAGARLSLRRMVRDANTAGAAGSVS